MKIAILGGTGREGSGLALRWGAAGEEIIIGSRDVGRAAGVAKRLNRLLRGTAAIHGASNLQAAFEADVAVLTVPYAAHLAVLTEVKEALRGKLLIDTTVPFDLKTHERLVPDHHGSALQEAQELLGPSVMVVVAFQNIGFDLLKDVGKAIDCDVLVCGDDPHARHRTVLLAAKAGLRAVDAGSSRHAGTVERLTSLLIDLKRRYKTKETGIRITGLPMCGAQAALPEDRP
ncbi:MAG: NADPH-dependent F420 reductase [candidate division NC10 bacterium]|nr:NADPH-dependent F420 reductase [candidate division NC10 bacterium]MDE2320880.1 NADPH-dependent F420 reductase [candidate division NC10 bacterium]